MMQKKKNNPKLEKLHKLSFLNRDLIEKEAYLCGCFYCKERYNPELIVEWTDLAIKRGGDGIRARTALCPGCGIDSVLPWSPKSDFLLTSELLSEMYEYFFTE